MGVISKHFFVISAGNLVPVLSSGVSIIAGCPCCVLLRVWYYYRVHNETVDQVHYTTAYWN